MSEKAQDLSDRSLRAAGMRCGFRYVISGLAPVHRGRRRAAKQARGNDPQPRAGEYCHAAGHAARRAALLNAADVFVLSSDIEGMPLVIGEALASGCAVVATDAAGVAELLGDAGEIVPRATSRHWLRA
ncbi:glycosyltransferase [Cupriavidus basilensis]